MNLRPQPNGGWQLLLPRGRPDGSGRNYKLLFLNTNWPPSELTYEAQLSGRRRRGPPGLGEARGYFTSLYALLNGPSLDLRLQALFELGLALMRTVDASETNRLANCEEATRAFGRLCDDYPTNRLAVPGVDGKGQLLFAMGAGPATIRFPDQCAERLPTGR